MALVTAKYNAVAGAFLIYVGGDELMNQRTHAWMAIRAVGLLDEVGAIPKLVSMVKPHVKSAAIGAWIPDMADSKKGSGDIDNHIMKMDLYDGGGKERFILRKDELLKRLGKTRRMNKFIRQHSILNDDWWAKPYKADPKPGEHLANRAMALVTMLIDLLIMGDPAVASFVPGKIKFAKNLHPKARTREEQVSTYFFMLSHFVADSCMPCHCDARSLASYNRGLHKELEKRWSRKVGTFFDKKKLLAANVPANDILATAKAVDRKFQITFPRTIPRLKAKDVWKEMMVVCRGSFALNNNIAPSDEFPFGSRKKAPLQRLLKDNNGKRLLKELDKVVIHDAILNIAMIWKHIWKTF